MNIEALRYFVSVAQYKSISKAAEALYITQPALSRNLQRLEKEIGVPLFKRNRGKMTCEITEAGQQCLQDAVKALSYMDNILSITSAYSQGERGTLTIGYGGLKDDWTLDWLSGIRSRYPNITVVPRLLNFGELFDRIADGSIDIATLYSGFDHLCGEDFEYLRIEKCTLQILVPRSHPFAQRTSVSVDELRGQKFVAYTREISPDFYDALYALCTSHGFAPEYVAEYDTTAMILSDIYSGYGISFFASISENPDSEKFSCVPVQTNADDDWPEDFHVALVYRKNNDSPCLQNALNIAKELRDTKATVV